MPRSLILRAALFATLLSAACGDDSEGTDGPASGTGGAGGGSSTTSVSTTATVTSASTAEAGSTGPGAGGDTGAGGATGSGGSGGSLPECEPLEWEGDATVTDAVSLAELAGVTSITGSLFVVDADITSLEGLECLVSVGNRLRIQELPLVDLHGLGSLESVGWLTLSDLPELKTLEGLENLGTVGSFFDLYNVDALTSITSLSSLTRVDAILSITAPALTSLDGLGSLEQLGGLDLSNLGISDLDALSGVTSSSLPFGIDIGSCEELEDISALAGVTEVGELRLVFNYSLPSIAALTVEVIDGDLDITGNDALVDLSGLESLTSVEGALEIYGNSDLTDISALSGVTAVQSLSVESNDLLTSLDGLGGITSVTSSLRIFDNDALTDLEGLSSLTTVGIVNDVNAGGDVEIGYNTALSDVGVLLGLTWFGPPATLNIELNPELPTCQADQVAAHLADLGWPGTANIAGNDDAGVCQ